MSSEGSISRWIAGLKLGERSAAQELWDRYRSKLLSLASRRLAGLPKRVVDEEDIAQSVFVSLCRGAAAGRFDDIRNRDDLFWLLLAITRQKSVSAIRRESAKKRGGGRVFTESIIANQDDLARQVSLDDLVGDEPTAEHLAMMEEESRRLLSLLRDDGLRKVAVSRIEGYTVKEIAADLAVTTRSVERKLQLIRSRWSEEFADAMRQSKN